ncbi:hypothetical protein M885DRAFT_541274 [Pelagophyceae sp. CCMP2097]|nr:hypothetical protein M885DRAFT_541274 [Pelagophyceae sp. CCMP2097]
MAAALAKWLRDHKFVGHESRSILDNANSLDDLALAQHHELEVLARGWKTLPKARFLREAASLRCAPKHRALIGKSMPVHAIFGTDFPPPPPPPPQLALAPQTWHPPQPQRPLLLLAPPPAPPPGPAAAGAKRPPSKLKPAKPQPKPPKPKIPPTRKPAAQPVKAEAEAEAPSWLLAPVSPDGAADVPKKSTKKRPSPAPSGPPPKKAAAAAAPRKKAAAKARPLNAIEKALTDAAKHDAPRATEVLVDSTESWVCCDTCSKWRRLPRGIAVRANSRWACAMSLAYGNCAIPQEDTKTYVNTYWCVRCGIKFATPADEDMDSASARCATCEVDRLRTTAAGPADADAAGPAARPDTRGQRKKVAQ